MPPCCCKKNLNASRSSEHPPVRGENVKTFRWNHNRLQSQNLYIAFKHRFPEGSNIIISTHIPRILVATSKKTFYEVTNAVCLWSGNAPPLLPTLLLVIIIIIIIIIRSFLTRIFFEELFWVGGVKQFLGKQKRFLRGNFYRSDNSTQVNSS